MQNFLTNSSSSQFGMRHGKSSADDVLNICEFIDNLVNKIQPVQYR